MRIHQHPSPNHGDRKGHRPRYVILHHTAMMSAEAALERLSDPEPEVSAHYLIGEDGTTWQLVDEARRAWHAGRSFWQGETDLNSLSIGIELANPGPLTGNPPFSEPQMQALETLLRGIQARWDITPRGVLGHSDIAIGRKTDPGDKFDWARLARVGLAQAMPNGSIGVAPGEFEDCLAAIGYDPAADPAARLQAFRLRWRCGPVPSKPDDWDRHVAALLAGDLQSNPTTV